MSHIIKTFKFEKILSQDPVTLTAAILGTAVPDAASGETVPAIVRVEKTKFKENDLEKFHLWGKTEEIFANDIYATVMAWFDEAARPADVKLSCICPATEKHIRKYATQELSLVHETPELYAEVVEPYIQSRSPSEISWVYNILDGTAEAEHVLLHTPEFVLTPDFKWDRQTLSSLYLLALVQDKSLKSIRDLTSSHLPLLRHIREESEAAALAEFGPIGLKKGQLRMFFHYQPTYYHLHVHVVHAGYAGFSGVAVGQAHLLDDIIDLLQLEQSLNMKTPIMKQRTLTYFLGDQHPLAALLPL